MTWGKTVYLETKEVAEMLGLSQTAVINAADSGRLKVAAMTRRGVRLFRVDDVERFRAARERLRGQS